MSHRESIVYMLECGYEPLVILGVSETAEGLTIFTHIEVLARNDQGPCIILLRTWTNEASRKKKEPLRKGRHFERESMVSEEEASLLLDRGKLIDWRTCLEEYLADQCIEANEWVRRVRQRSATTQRHQAILRLSQSCPICESALVRKPALPDDYPTWMCARAPNCAYHRRFNPLEAATVWFHDSRSGTP